MNETTRFRVRLAGAGINRASRGGTRICSPCSKHCSDSKQAPDGGRRLLFWPCATYTVGVLNYAVWEVMPKKSKSPPFAGDVVTQTPVQAQRKDRALVLTVDETLADQLGLTGENLSAATVQLADGQTILLVAAAGGDGPLQVIRKGGSIEVFAPAETDENDLVVDESTEAFLLLKQTLFERGELELSKPLSAEDFLALGAEKFKAIERLLDK